MKQTITATITITVAIENGLIEVVPFLNETMKVAELRELPWIWAELESSEGNKIVYTP